MTNKKAKNNYQEKEELNKSFKLEELLSLAKTVKLKAARGDKKSKFIVGEASERWVNYAF